MFKWMSKNTRNWLIAMGSLMVFVVGVLIYYFGFYIREKYGYMQNIPRNYDNITYEDWMDDSVSNLGELETASDLPKATSSYTLLYDVFGK